MGKYGGILLMLIRQRISYVQIWIGVVWWTFRCCCRWFDFPLRSRSVTCWHAGESGVDQLKLRPLKFEPLRTRPFSYWRSCGSAQMLQRNFCELKNGLRALYLKTTDLFGLLCRYCVWLFQITSSWMNLCMSCPFSWRLANTPRLGAIQAEEGNGRSCCRRRRRIATWDAFWNSFVYL